MKRKRWFVVSLMAAVMAVGITTGVVMAQGSGDPEGDSPFKSFVSRVAEILGIDEAQVQEAIDQAAREIQDERLQQKLDRLVESGRLTQEQAVEYRDWIQSRPEGLSPRFGFRRFGGFGGGFGSKFHGHGHWGPPAAPTRDSGEATTF